MIGKPKKTLGNNLLLNLVRQITDILFPIITFTYVTRKLHVDIYGKVSFYNSVVSYFVLLATFGITNYAIRELASYKDNKSKFENLFNELFSLCIITTVLSYVILFVLAVFWNKINKDPLLLIILSFSIILNTIGVEYVFNVFEDYYYITVRSIIIRGASLLLLILFVNSPEDYLVYASIIVLSSSGANIYSFFYARKYVCFRPTVNVSIFKHFKPMFVFFINSITVAFYVNSDVTIIGMLMNERAVGLYSVAANIYNIIKRLINGIGIVFLPRVSNYKNTNRLEDYYKLVKLVFSLVITLLLPVIVGLYMMSKNVITFFFGLEYFDAINSLKLLCFSMFFAVMSNFIITMVLIPFVMERYIMVITIISAVVNVLLNFCLIPFWGIEAAALTTVISELLVFVFSFVGLKKVTNRKLIDYKDALVSILGSTLIVLTCKFISCWCSNIFIEMVLSVLLSLVSYYIICLLFGVSVIKRIKEFGFAIFSNKR